MSDYRELLIGCGYSRDKLIEPRVCLKGSDVPAAERNRWHNLDTLDYEGACNPTIVWDLNRTPWCRAVGDDGEPEWFEPLQESEYDEVHAYEVLEHLGQQGDFRAFFRTFSEIWRLLKPGGLLAATVPSRFDQWAWGDPGHTRIIPPCALIFLSQLAYADQHGKTPMTDYRRHYHADFDVLHSTDDHNKHVFILQAVKPTRQVTLDVKRRAQEGLRDQHDVANSRSAPDHPGVAMQDRSERCDDNARTV